MKSGLVAFGIFLIVVIIFLKYFVVQMIVQDIASKFSQYVGSAIASSLVTADNIQRFCSAINSNVGVFGISIQDIAKIVSPDTVNKCNQFQVLMEVVSFEYLFYIFGFISIAAGVALGGKRKEVEKHKDEEEEAEEKEPEEEEEKPRKGKKFCSECGSLLKPKDKFCGKCGIRVLNEDKR